MSEASGFRLARSADWRFCRDCRKGGFCDEKNNFRDGCDGRISGDVVRIRQRKQGDDRFWGERARGDLERLFVPFRFWSTGRGNGRKMLRMI